MGLFTRFKKNTQTADDIKNMLYRANNNPGLYGAVLGDLCGSRYEFEGQPDDNFKTFTRDCFITDDSIMTVAIADACLTYKSHGGDFRQLIIDKMREYGNKFPGAGYGSSFSHWLFCDNPEPYNSWGNGSAMRTSAIPVVFHDSSSDKVRELARTAASATHDHPEGIKGAEIVSMVIHMGLNGMSLNDAMKYAANEYDLSWDYDKILKDREGWYKTCVPDAHPQIMRSKDIYFDVSCQGTVPLALSCLFSGNSFTDVIRKAVLLRGDTDTTAAIAGSMAEAFFEIPEEMKAFAREKLTEESVELTNIVKAVG